MYRAVLEKTGTATSTAHPLGSASANLLFHIIFKTALNLAVHKKPPGREMEEVPLNGQLKKQLEDSRYLKRGMKENLEDCAETRWLAKPVLSTRSLPLAEDLDSLRLRGPGILSVDKCHSVSGTGSIKLSLPTEGYHKHPGNRAFSVTTLIRRLPGENLEGFNRISLWLLVDSPGTASNFVTLSIHNQGKHIMPLPGRFEGTHALGISHGKWQRVVWEFPYVYRDHVTGISLDFHACRTPVPAPQGITAYVDDMRLEQVKEDHYKGFDLRRDSIAYCHSGYRPGTSKQAYVQNRSAFFSLRDTGGKVVFRGPCIPQEDGFQLLDFTEVDAEGWYTLEVDSRASKPFYIGKDAYISAAWKTLNFFFVERCGYDVPGVHTECHMDVMSVHPDGRKLPVCGGWHDAGDLTQAAINTAESVFAMLELALSTGDTHLDLSRRALEEARWGLNWLMRTRWGDGYRHNGTVIGYWSDNVVGTLDDISAPAGNRPFDNFMIAGVCAKAVALFRDEDPMFADWCARCAKEDFAFALASMNQSQDNEGAGSHYTQLQMNAQAAISAMELYEAFGEEEYLSLGASFARILMACQETTALPAFTIPFKGYFYESETHDRIQTYYHRSYEHVPVKALAMLYRLAPEHTDAARWKASLELSREYVALSFGTAPYGLLPNGIYELDNTDFSIISHEGNRAAGAPSLEEYNAQVLNGIKLSDRHYLRIFPVAYQFRGFHATLMGRALAAMELARVLSDRHMKNIAIRQMEWILGCNPFASSSMYGEGYDYHPLYAAMSPQIVGAVPVGFETFENEDLPFYPMQNNATYKEVWVHTTCRLMWLIAML